MKIIQFIIVFFVVVILLSCNGNSDKTYYPVEFKNITLDQALVQSKEKNKPIFIDAYASWCGFCKKMKNKVYSDQKVSSYMNEHYINLSIDMENGEGPEIASRYRVEAYPTLIILNSDGEVHKSHTGYLNVAEFLEFIQ